MHADQYIAAADDYRADSGPFLELLRQYGIAAPGLREQLQETARYLEAS